MVKDNKNKYNGRISVGGRGNNKNQPSRRHPNTREKNTTVKIPAVPKIAAMAAAVALPTGENNSRKVAKRCQQHESSTRIKPRGQVSQTFLIRRRGVRGDRKRKATVTRIRPGRGWCAGWSREGLNHISTVILLSIGRHRVYK